MGINLDFEDNTMQIKEALANSISSFLHEAGGELQAQTARNSRVDTGQTKGSYDYVVNEKNNSTELQVGSNYENAIWEEFGTGEYALHGNGRKGGWTYQDRNGEWHKTRGKSANRPLFKAFTANREKLKRRAVQVVKESVGC